MAITYSKAPFNYIGNKYKLLPQIMPLFKNSDSVVDLFCGGCDVISNINASRRYANDINGFVIDICRYFQEHDIDEIITRLDSIINRWELTQTNKEGYNKLRDYYNNGHHDDPMILYVLVCYGFNHQFRFNSKHEFNNPFGANRSSFNDSMRRNLVAFKERIDDIIFSVNDFRDFNIEITYSGGFLYADPPYLITTGSYNDGKRGFKGWGQQDDSDLFELLDGINSNNGFFAMSNVLEHKGLSNDLLKKWVKNNGYYVNIMNFNYNNSNYHTKNRQYKTVEVLITNYKAGDIKYDDERIGVTRMDTGRSKAH